MISFLSVKRTVINLYFSKKIRIGYFDYSGSFNVKIQTKQIYYRVNAYLILIAAEMWFGIVFAVVVEIVPLHLRSTTIGAFLFVMNNIGGNLPILVEPTRMAIGFRESLYIYYAGFYGISKYFTLILKYRFICIILLIYNQLPCNPFFILICIFQFIHLYPYFIYRKL